jgi:DNA invertase Pin-like site-specific DNA recombinase
MRAGCSYGLYDDGGFSGGDTDRPALQRLLADVQAGKIDVIVVYKVDRLTRSVADFAKLVELFDQHSVSFVSVTQQFKRPLPQLSYMPTFDIPANAGLGDMGCLRY